MLLARRECAEVVIRAFAWSRDQGWCRLLGFVVMPDHYHLIIALGEVKTLDRLLSTINRFSAKQINDILGSSGAFWEEGYYDHQIRDRTDFDAILGYVHDNPVADGLVASAEEWPYSTANPRFADWIDWEWLGPSLRSVVRTKHRFSPAGVPRRYG
jgi:REP element-mobilizing transposase RayT